MKPTATLARFASIAGALSLITVAHAEIRYWDGGIINMVTNGDGASAGGNGTWDTTLTNWDNGAAPHVAWVNANNDTAVFGGAAGTVTLGTAITAGGLSFNTTGYSLSNNNTLTMAGTGPTITTATGVTATINTQITGAGGFSKEGDGTLTLTHNSTNYTGVTTVNAGILNFIASAASPLLASATTLNAGGTFRIEQTGTFNHTFNTNFKVTLDGGTLDHSKTANWSIFNGLVTVNSASFITNRNTVLGASLYFDGGITGSGNLTINNVGDGIANANDALAGMVFRMNSVSANLTGTVTVNGGYLGYGASSNELDAARLNLVGASLSAVNTTASDVTLGSLEGNTASTIVLANKLTVGGRNEDTNFAGVFSGAGSFAKTGTGIQTFSGTNTYSGGTTITNGTLALGHATDTLANAGAVTVDGGTAVLSIGANTDTVGTVTLKNGGSITGSTGTLTGSSYAFESGSVSAKLGGAGALNKTTGGTVTLSGANTYSGPTSVSAGMLLVNGSLDSSSAVSVTAGTLGGTGVIGGTVTVTGTGMLSAGASIESLVTGNLSMATNTTFVYEAANNGSSGADLTAVNGTLSLTNVTLSLDNATLTALASGSFGAGNKLTLISYKGPDIISGFAGYADDTNYLFGSNVWTFNYNDVVAGNNFGTDAVTGGQNRFVTMTMVPEPASVLLGGMGLLALLRRRRD